VAGTLVFVETHQGRPERNSLGVLSGVAGLGDDVTALVCGSGVADAGALGRFGASRVLVADDPVLAAPLPQPRVDVLARTVSERGFDAVVLASSVLAADVAAGLAARLDAGLNWDLTGLERRDGRLIGIRPALQDSVVCEVAWRGSPAVALVRSGSYEPAETGGSAEVEPVPVAVEEWSRAAVLVEHVQEASDGPAIEEAEVVVAGGRGLGGPENFALVEELAMALGGAVGATRAVVDAGWYPYSTQVGQTGKTVAPKLYVAVGISGAIQHKVGMQNAGTIVAINKDPHAPIFEFCDLGVVGDLHAVVPRLTELVKARRGG
jgi:electron transfer flavoprotein alpha subunit